MRLENAGRHFSARAKMNAGNSKIVGFSDVQREDGATARSHRFTELAFLIKALGANTAGKGANANANAAHTDLANSPRRP